MEPRRNWMLTSLKWLFTVVMPLLEISVRLERFNIEARKRQERKRDNTRTRLEIAGEN